MVIWLYNIYKYNIVETKLALCSRRKNNRQKILPAHFMITKRDFILRGSYFCEQYNITRTLLAFPPDATQHFLV